MQLWNWLKQRRARPSAPPCRPTILALSIPVLDRLALERLGQIHDWELYLLTFPPEAFRLVSRKHFDLILCGRSQPGYPWREVMDVLATKSPDSRIVLVSPTGGEDLWSDVVQLGGHSVLASPLREGDMLQLMDAATHVFLAPASGVR